ncbi:hypothetical protein TUM4438_44880 [Shewanella sairae]|uniref:IPT/TIG domain-containing protein n=1 Tax=Shewanella sairae TaxID=190310 RepID=A0ABQ4PRL5_9GAMM|nr:IPT/TIG domain-containing protein [Shewanella sairae]MCL1130942.1 IPT/TIG domain-containing protein [Shewanella sairae]GIU52356.1 hypothetical protein TUM4438_44880 [Shewanella sairae]
MVTELLALEFKSKRTLTALLVLSAINTGCSPEQSPSISSAPAANNLTAAKPAASTSTGKSQTLAHDAAKAESINNTQMGSWENKDEDNDGIPDEQDDYPFDASKQRYPTTTESTFNDNPAVATKVQYRFPFTLEGAFEERGDGDVYNIQIDQEVIDADEPITFLLLMDDLKYKPTISILDKNGRAIFEIKNNTVPLGAIGSLATVKFKTAGTYYIAIAEQNLAGGSSASYKLKAFIDKDYDGLPLALEKALSINEINPDTDGDGIYDGNEFYVKTFGDQQLDLDMDNIPNWLDSDADNDSIPDNVELLSDADSDGIGAFVDTDSDGNTISDNEEALDVNSPVDTDHDGVFNFLDRDDDSDGLFDVNDNKRMAKITLTDDFQVFALRYSDNLGVNLIDRSFPGERVFIQGQDLPVSDATLVIQNDSEIYNLKLTNFENDGFYVHLPETISDEEDFEYFISDGEQRSYSKYFRVSSHLTPIIQELASGSNYTGEQLTITGRNLQPNMVVHIGSITVSPDSVVNDQAVITIPSEATSNFIYV